MIKIYFGEDRAKIQEKIQKEFGEDYEVFEGEEIVREDMPSIFFGTSLLSEKRKILIKDFSENKEVFSEILKFLNTEHEVILFESKFDKRTTTYKELKAKKVEMIEVGEKEKKNINELFQIFDVAMKDGKRAVEMTKKIEATEDAYAFVGLMTSTALKNFQYRQGEKEKRVLKELSKLDVSMKTTSIQPWSLVRTFLLRLSSL